MPTTREVAESYWAAECSRDIDAVLTHYHPDALYQDGGGLLRGHAQIRTFYEGSFRDYPDLEVAILREYVLSPDSSALEVRAVLTDHGGRRFGIEGLIAVIVRDGKFVSVRCYEDPLMPLTRPIEGTLVRSYSTSFEQAEAPLSEGGMWLNGRKDGIDWCDVLTEDGHVYGEVSRMNSAERRAEQVHSEAIADGEAGAAVAGDYDDPAANLSGTWGPNQSARATVFCRNPTDDYFQEVEIRLRSSIKPHWCDGYEVFWRCSRSDAAYAEIVRWNGKIADWTSLARRVGPEFGVQDGDVVEATIVGNVITSYINGVEVLSVTDDTFVSGAPGVGFNFFVGDTNVDHGFKDFTVDTYD